MDGAAESRNENKGTTQPHNSPTHVGRKIGPTRRATKPEAISIAIIGALVVEHEIEESIRRRFQKITDDEWLALLADESGPVSTFDRKVKLAKCFGIFDPAMKSNFDIIREVRNLFAHSKRLINFDHPLIVTQLDKIAPPKNNNRSFAKIGKMNQPHQRFVLLCILCVSVVSKRRFAVMQAAHKAWMKRRKLSPIGSLVAELLTRTPSPSRLPTPTSPHPLKKTASGPKALTHAGLLGGLLSSSPPPSNSMGGLFGLGMGILNERKN
jgi:hypothetical protein